MSSVWYIGTSDSRTITAAQWTAAGVTGTPATVTWNKGNGWSIPRASLAADQLAILDGDGHFNTNAADGPRPGGAVSAPESPILRKSDLTALGIDPDQLGRRLFPVEKRPNFARDDTRLGSVTTDLTAVNINLTGVDGGIYTQSYAISGGARPADWPVDEGEGIQQNVGDFGFSSNSAFITPRMFRVMCDGDRFAWYTGNQPSDMRIYIDGKPASATPYVDPGNVPHFNEIVFPDAKPRLIEVRTLGYIASVYTRKPYRVWKPVPRRGPRMLVVGDSYATQIGAGSVMAGAYHDLGPLVGVSDLWVDGIGGTGYGVTSAVDGIAGGDRFLDRLQKTVFGKAWDLATINPDVFVVHGGGLNDLYKGRTPAQVIADATALFTTARQKLPNAKLVFVEGFTPPGFPYHGNYTAIRTALQTALASVGVYYIDVTTTSPWFTGTGNTSTPAGNGNSDVYIGSDNAHPNAAGHLYMRSRMADRLLRVLNDNGALVNQLV